MANRPIGVYLICGFFVLIGSKFLFGGFSQFTLLNTIPAEQVPSILRIVPIFMILLGLLGIFAGATLWLARPAGQISGLLWLVLWSIQQIVIANWIANGPEMLQEASSVVVGGSIVRILVAGILFYYLWTRGSTYIYGNNTDSSSSTVQTG